MSYRKYLNDFIIEKYTDANGKVRTRTVYIAGDYALNPEVSGNDKRIVLSASVLSWAALLGALIVRTSASKISYVILPYAFSALPLYLMTEAAILHIREGELMNRDRAERIANRLRLCPLIAAVLSGAAFLGLIVTAFLKWESMVSGDIAFCAFSLVSTAAESVAYTKYRGIRAYKYDPD